MAARRIAVTGGNGALGRMVVKRLSERADVTALDIRPGPTGVHSRHCDVESFYGVRAALQGHDEVVHLAALLTLDHAEERIFTVNVRGTWNVLEAAHDLGIQRVVLASSECTTGVINVRRVPRAPIRYLPIDEDHPLGSVEAYGLSKQVLEVMGQSYARRGMDIVALRPTLIVMPWMADYIDRTRKIDDPDLWSYVEASDVVAAIDSALTAPVDGFATAFLSAVDTFSPEPTLAFVERVQGWLPEVRDKDLYERNPYAALWNLDRARSLLGFEPRSDWRRLLLAGLHTGSTR